MTVKEGQVAPAISLKDQTGTVRKLTDYKGKWVVVYYGKVAKVYEKVKPEAHAAEVLADIERLK